MTKGALLIARNNSQVDYVKQAAFCAKRIVQHLGIPVSIITDSAEYADKFDVFDNVIEIPNQNNYHHKNYNDGLWSRTTLEFKNTSRCDVYELTPYDQTLLMDTDVILGNDHMKHVFAQQNDLLLYKDATELSNWRDLSEFDYISPNSIDFYWATVVYFNKSKITKTFFDLVKHIQENWFHYRNLYQIKNATFRNDFAFSIAIHIMNGYTQNKFVGKMPGTLYYTLDADVCHNIDENRFQFLIEKQTSDGYFPAVTNNSTVHIMNKFSLNRVIDES
jgi:hypothetical protein